MPSEGGRNKFDEQDKSFGEIYLTFNYKGHRKFFMPFLTVGAHPCDRPGSVLKAFRTWRIQDSPYGKRQFTTAAF